MSTSTVLIIDDDRDFVDSTRAILESEQYRVMSAYGQGEGFAKLEEETPDVIILDVMMGQGAEGFIFARKMRKDPRFAQIPILMLTGMSEQTGFRIPGNPIHPKFLPVDEFVEKPIKSHDLLEKVEACLVRKNAKGAKKSRIPGELSQYQTMLQTGVQTENSDLGK